LFIDQSPAQASSKVPFGSTIDTLPFWTLISVLLAMLMIA